MRMNRLILVLAVVLGMCGEALGANQVAQEGFYKAGTSSACSETASVENGWTAGDLDAARAAAGVSSTCYICAGTYTNTEINSDGMLSVMDGQTIEGAGPTLTILDATGGSEGHCIYGDDDDGVTIKNLSVTGATTRGIELRNTDTLTIDNCYVYSNGQVGVYIYAQSEDVDVPTITNCRIYTNGRADQSADHQLYLHAIVNYTITEPVIQDNIVYSTTDKGYNGIRLRGQYADPNQGNIAGGTITGNEVYGCEYGGINLDGNTDDVEVTDNYIHNLEWFGVHIEGTDGAAGNSDSNTISGNTITNVDIRGDDGSGILFDEFSGAGNTADSNIISDCEEAGIKVRSSSQNIKNNIIIGDGTNEIGIEYQTALVGTCPATSNNTIYGDFSNACIGAATGTCAAGAGTIQNNICYDSGATPTGIKIHSLSAAVEDYNDVYGFTNNCDDETPGGGSCAAHIINLISIWLD